LEKQSEQQKLKDIIASREDGFGYHFKTARDEKNLSVDDVARELHLDKKIILALESEDYTQLPVATFVCGYIRNYAKFLKIQAEPLIEYYKKDRSDGSFEPNLKITRKKHTPGNSILSALLMPVMTVLILVALTAGGWQIWLYVSKNYLSNASNTSSESIESETSITDDDSGTLLLPDPGESYNAPEEELIEQNSNEPASSEGSLPVEDSLPVEGSLPAEGSIPAEGSASVDGSIPVEDSLSAEGSPPAEGSTSVDSSVNESIQASGNSQPALVVDNQLILEFSGNSWVSIKDADSKILSTGLKKASKILKLNGKLPYKVFLGDARVVKITINGKEFDHSMYINKKNIARFDVK